MTTSPTPTLWSMSNLTNHSTTYTSNSGVNLIDLQPWRSLVIVLYSVVISFGFFANLLVVMVIVRHKQLHTITNIFICLLSIADVMLCVFNMPLQLHSQLNG